MTALSNAHYAGVVDAYDFRSIRKLVDVGGGHGRLTRHFKGREYGTVRELMTTFVHESFWLCT
jgi:16S rRNA A1518/A1519 N6-dimethyltransferase RsmA/KsgA/DIM1 with predicted DNA glycosylase/AP lyase activity